MKNEKYLKKFVGDNYEKITKGKFNIPGFFFTSLYMYYRKMYLYGIIVFIVELLISLFLNKFYLMIIINILCGFFVNKIYLKYAEDKINKIINNNQDNIDETIKEKGGTSWFFVIIGLVIEIVISIILIVALGIKVGTKIIEEVTDDTQIKLLDDYVAGDYNGILIYDSDIKISEEFTIDVPSEFLNNSSDEQYSYQYESGNEIFKACRFSLAVPIDYTDASNLIMQMQKYFKDNNPTEVKTETINNITWSTFNMINDIGKTYYYGTTKNNKVYLLEYEVQSGIDSSCENYRNQVLNSIKVK